VDDDIQKPTRISRRIFTPVIPNPGGQNRTKCFDTAKKQRTIFGYGKNRLEKHMNPKVSVEYVDSVVVATFTSERILEDVDIQALEKTLLPLVDQDRKPLIILDFSNVKFLTSAVLGLLIRILKKVNEAGGGLRFCGINAKILEIFNITRLDKVFEILPTREKALLEFR
jgi:anti-sigma B factor antagonist